jgi:hypothetical protein
MGNFGTPLHGSLFDAPKQEDTELKALLTVDMNSSYARACGDKDVCFGVHGLHELDSMLQKFRFACRSAQRPFKKYVTSN